MVSEKSFQLLVATKTIPFFVVVPIISDHRCISGLLDIGKADVKVRHLKTRFKNELLKYESKIRKSVKLIITYVE